jgi:hypothetical protein
MTVFGALMLGWLAFIVAFAIVWARFHSRVRAREGIDEAAYVDGLVDPSTMPTGGLTHARSTSGLAAAVRRAEMDRHQRASRPRRMAAPMPPPFPGRPGRPMHPAGIR